MATSKIHLTKNTWTLLSSVSCTIQNLGSQDIFFIEKASLPSDLTVYKKLSPE